MQMRRQIDASIYAEAPSARVLVERRESAHTFDQLARHEATLQRALNRTLAEFRRLRDASVAAARSNAAEPVPSAHPEPAPSGDGRPPVPQGPRTQAGSAHAGGGHADGNAFLQNEPNSAQTSEEAGDTSSRENPPAAPPVA